MDYLYTKLTNMEFFSLKGDIESNKLEVIELGHSTPTPERRVRCYADCFHLHFIVSGSGCIDSAPVKCGQGFLVRDGTFYTEEVGGSGLEQYWINFRGDRAAELLDECGVSGIFGFGQCFSRVKDRLTAAFDDKFCGRLSMLGLLFSLCGLIDRRDEVGEDSLPLHIRTAEDFVRKCYSEPLSIQRIADECHISPKYLSRIYCETRKTTLVGFINSTRLEAAKRLIERTEDNISQIAYSVGFSDPLYFSKAFKKCFGASPTEYRRICRPACYG